MSRNQKIASSKVTLDAKKFLGTINDGLSGQVVQFEHKLNKLGQEYGTSLRLVSVNSNFIYFEDIKSNTYYKADFKKEEGNKIILENIQEIRVVDKKKSEIFEKACMSLVKAIQEGLNEDGELVESVKADKIFKSIEHGYCVPKVIPESGIVRTRDNKLHHIMVNESYVSSGVIPSFQGILLKLMKEGKIKFADGNIICEGKTEKNPISELMRRQVAIRHMRVVAENAYTNPEFRSVIKNIAGHISNSDIKSAIGIAKPYLIEEQEYCTLTKSKIGTLIENSLYAEGHFNPRIIRDTTELVWRTNVLSNRAAILEEWQKCAEKTKVGAFISNYKVLVESAKRSPELFMNTYEKFLTSINEDSSSKAIKAQAYLNMLKLMKNAVAGADADEAVSSTIDELMVKLESDINNIDDALLFEVEDLLATVSPDLIQDTSSLADFDQTPEPVNAETFGGDEEMLGDFAGDMSEEPVGGGDALGAGGLGADLGGPGAGPEGSGVGPEGLGAGPEGAESPEGAGAGPEATLDVDENGQPKIKDESDEEKEPELSLDHLIRTAKPISEMTVEDVKVIAEAAKKCASDCEEVEVKGKEFKKFKRSKHKLDESQIVWFKSVMDKAKSLDKVVAEQLGGALGDLMSDKVISEEDSDTKGKTWEKPWEKKDKEDKDEVKIDDSYGDKKPKVGEKEVKVGEKVEESVSIVVDNVDDNKLIDMISQIVSGAGGAASTAAAVPAVVDTVPPAAPVAQACPACGNQPCTCGAQPAPISADPANATGGSVIADCNMAEGKKKEDDKEDEAKAKKEKDCKDDKVVKEDSDITDPTHPDYDSEKDAKTGPDGKKMNPEVKLSDDGYDGTGDVNTAKDKPKAGHPQPGNTP